MHRIHMSHIIFYVFLLIFFKIYERDIIYTYMHPHTYMHLIHMHVCNAVQRSATHCNTLQHTATHCNTLQHTATHSNTLQHTATHCNIYASHTHACVVYAHKCVYVCTHTYTQETRKYETQRRIHPRAHPRRRQERFRGSLHGWCRALMPRYSYDESCQTNHCTHKHINLRAVKLRTDNRSWIDVWIYIHIYIYHDESCQMSHGTHEQINFKGREIKIKHE